MSIWLEMAAKAGAAKNALLDLLLPRHCLLCALPSGRSAVCPPCAGELPLLGPATCPVCAHPLPGITAGARSCGRCLSHPPAFDATLACYVYAPPIDRLIQSIKYGRRLTAADFLGRQFAALGVLHGLPGIDRIVPMPLSPARLAERGFNQALELARAPAVILGCTLDIVGVRRTRHTRAQVELPWKERRDNIRGAFAASGHFDGEHVLVVDDVMTTGATLDELARVLKMQGAARVTNVVVARTLRES